MEAKDICIFCGQVPCECGPKKASKSRPKRKKSPPSKPSTPVEVAQEAAPQQARPEPKRKSAARPERDPRYLVDNEVRNREEESELFWTAMRNLVNEGMLHEISVKYSLDAYPSIPRGLY